MDFTRNNTRLYHYCIAALALALAVVDAETVQYYRPSATYAYTAVRNIVITNHSQGDLYIFPSVGNSLAISQGQTALFNATTTINISGLSSSNTPVNGSGSIPSRSFTWNRPGQPQLGSRTVEGFSFDCAANYSTSIPYTSNHSFATATFTVTTNGTATVTIDPWPAANPPPTDPDPYESGIFLFDNQTGVEQEMQLGDEVVKLAPGMNSILYHGEVDSNGYPKSLPDEFAGRRVLDENGKPVIHGTLKNGIEYNTLWATPPLDPFTIFPPSASSGATIKTEGSNGDPVYSQLPKGMTPSSGNPLPGGMTIGTIGLPSGMTPGLNGALPNGVVSGGGAFLPSGVSPGVFPNPFPSGLILPGSGIRPPGTRTGDPGVVPGTPTSPPSGGSGGTGSTPPPTSITGGDLETTERDDTTAGTFGGSGSLSGFGAQAREMGNNAGNEVGEAMGSSLGKIGDAVASPFGSGGAAFWTAPGESFFEGYDNSWMNMNLNLGSQNVNINLPPEWLAMLRQILLWIMRIYFVMGCIKILLK